MTNFRLPAVCAAAGAAVARTVAISAYTLFFHPYNMVAAVAQQVLSVGC